jgi:hypothetical protein
MLKRTGVISCLAAMGSSTEANDRMRRAQEFWRPLQGPTAP